MYLSRKRVNIKPRVYKIAFLCLSFKHLQYVECLCDTTLVMLSMYNLKETPSEKLELYNNVIQLAVHKHKLWEIKQTLYHIYYRQDSNSYQKY